MRTGPINMNITNILSGYIRIRVIGKSKTEFCVSRFETLNLARRFLSELSDEDKNDKIKMNKMLLAEKNRQRGTKFW